MMTRELFLRSMSALREFLSSDDPAVGNAIEQAYQQNPWFIPSFSKEAFRAISRQYLDEEKCGDWLSHYPVRRGASKNVGIIMAGNVPLVGFHDLLCVLASGHRAIIKLSEKDAILSRLLTDHLIKLDPIFQSYITYTSKLVNYDAVIATGSNNSARYFEYYFRDHPHILRKNRNGVAVLTGNETDEEIELLGRDIFLYFGLGCRNVSKLFVPEGYDFERWHSFFRDWAFVSEHHKYRHNLDYNHAIYIINQVPHVNLGHLVLKEDDSIASRIGCVYYSFYMDQDSLPDELSQRQNEIQCLVSIGKIGEWEHIQPGMTQEPELSHYADGIDTMDFLTSLT
jgi:hypothetical protein